MKIIKKLMSIIAIATTLVMPLQAHPGKLDGNGGHHDNKNVSGLGSYHYHDGLDGTGYPAHLHNNGVCPYANVHVEEVGNQGSDNSSVKTSSTKKSTVPTFTVNTYSFQYGAKTFSAQGTVKNGTTLVTLRDLCNNLGITIDSIENGVIKLSAKDRTLSIGIGNSKAYTNQGTIDLTTPAISHNSTTYVPLKDVLAALGYTLSKEGGKFNIQ